MDLKVGKIYVDKTGRKIHCSNFFWRFKQKWFQGFKEGDGKSMIINPDDIDKEWIDPRLKEAMEIIQDINDLATRKVPDNMEVSERDRLHSIGHISSVGLDKIKGDNYERK